MEQQGLERELKALRETVARQEKQLRELAARQAIQDCTTRFCRGVNRRDRDVLRSVFHPDAIDDHGHFVGDREAILDWIDSVYTGVSVTQHFVTNQLVELDGDTAHAETYWFVANVGLDGNSVILRGGRYIDRFECREGVWAIARRACLVEWNAGTNPYHFPPEAQAALDAVGISSRDKTDLSYMRPLEITRSPRSGNPHKKS